MLRLLTVYLAATALLGTLLVIVMTAQTTVATARRLAQQVHSSRVRSRGGRLTAPAVRHAQ